MLQGRSVLALFAVLGFASTSSAETHDYYGKAGLKLGSGFRKLNVSSNPPPCLVVSKATVTEDDIVGNFQLQTTLIRDRQQLYSLLHIDAHLAARSLAANANVDTSFDKETSMDSDDLTWVMYAYQEFGSETIDPVFNDRAASLKASPKLLIQRCGQEYVQSVKKASQVAAVFTLHSLNQSTKSTLEAHFSGGASWAGNQVNFSANYKSFLSEASQHGSVEVKIFGFGGGGLAKLSNIVSHGDDFENVRSTLATYLSTEMVASKAVPISFTTASFGDLTDPPISVSPVGNPPQLDSVYLEYGNVLSRIRKAEEMVARSGRYGYVTDEQVKYLNETKKSLAVHLAKLQAQANQCNQSAEKCEFPDIDSTIVNWPLSPEQNCSRWGPGVCAECEIPVSFLGVLTGKTFTYGCSHMKEGASVHVKFEGLYITINDAEPGNVVWNAWITASLKGLDPCDRCSLSRISPGLGAPNVPQNQVQLDYHWKEFDFDGFTKAVGGKAQVHLVIDHCQSGDHSTTCDSAPPGTGSPRQDVPNRGFPVPYPPPQAKIRFTTE